MTTPANTPTKMKLNLAKSGHQHRPEDITYIAKEAAHNKSGQSVYMCVVCGEITKLLNNNFTGQTADERKQA